MHNLSVGDVTATFNYLRDPPTDDRTIPMVYDAIHGEKTTMRLEPIEMRVSDGRGKQSDFSLDREGLTLVPHRCAITDFLDRSQTDEIFSREAIALVREITGAVDASSLGSNVRFGRRRNDYAVTSDHKPARFVHADFTDESAASLLAGRALPQGYTRWALYNVWKVFSSPPQDFPLALCDARTVSKQDEDAVQILLDVPGKEAIRSMTVAYYPNPSNRWVYFSNMTVDEILIFKGFDSDPARPRRVPHSAFANPLVGPECATRNSIETRIIAFFR